MLENIEEITIAELHQAYRSGATNARDVVAAYLERIRSIDGGPDGLNSVISVAEDALERAGHLDDSLRETGRLAGPLHGVPLLLKDHIETKGIPTTFGSAQFRDYRPAASSTVVDRLTQAGAIILGKTTMPDFASSWFSTSSLSGLTRNPYDISYDPGGSSSGTAAAVAANLALAGIGGDTGGSVRLPASYCNLVGLRVTPGLVSTAGVAPLCAPIDTLGPMARTVTDAAILLDSMVGYDPLDPATAEGALRSGGVSYSRGLDESKLAGRRLGVLRQVFSSPENNEEAEVTEVIEEAVEKLRSGGAVVIDIEIPDLESFVFDSSLYFTRSYSDIDSFLKPRSGSSLAEFRSAGHIDDGLDLLVLISEGIQEPFDDPDYARKLLTQVEFRTLVQQRFLEHRLDAVIYPDARRAAPSHADIRSGRWTNLTYPTNTIIASQLAFPAMTVPVGFTPGGLPIGLELVALPFQERHLLQLARAVEAQIPARRNPLAN